MTSAPSDLLTRWLSYDIEVSKLAFDDIRSLGRGALPVLCEAIDSGSPKQFAACELVLAMEASEVREIVVPLFDNPELMAGLSAVIGRAKESLPCLWPSLTGALLESDRKIRLRALDAIQSQITRAKIEELCFESWADELLDPMAVLAADHDFYVSVKAAELISTLPLRSEAISRALEDSLPRFLEKKQSGLSYFARALTVQNLPDATKTMALGDIMRQGIYGHDRYVAVLCAGELGVSARSLLPDCQSVLESMTTAKPAASRGQLKRLREVLELIEGRPGNNSSKPGMSFTHPRLQVWMNALENEEISTSSSTHEVRTIAREQIKRSKDESLVGPIIEALSSKVTPNQYQDLSLMVNCLLSNTGNTELLAWLCRECCSENLKPKQIDALLYVSHPEVMSLVKRVMFTNNGAYTGRCLDHLKRDASDESVDLLCAAGRRDSSLRLLVIFALEETRSLRAVPYLLELAKRDLESKKTEELDWRAFSIHALGKLGDVGVVPALCELLENRGPSAMILCALADLGEPRGLAPAIGSLRRLLEGAKYSPSWSAGYRTPVYNVFLLARKCGGLDDPELIALTGEIRRNGVWEKLLPEESAFLNDLRAD